MTYDAHEIAEVFGRAAPTYDTVIPFFRTLGARLAEIADPRQGEAVLDVGCGRGATLFPVAERVGPGGRVLAVDLAEGMVEAVRADVSARGLSHVEVACMDAEHLDVDPGTFDLVVCSMLLHLVPDPPAAAASIAHAVRPGGRCAASVPAEGGPAWAFLGEVFDRYAAGRPMIVPFRPDFDLAGTLAGAGLDVTSTVVEEFTFTSPTRTCGGTGPGPTACVACSRSCRRTTSRG